MELAEYYGGARSGGAYQRKTAVKPRKGPVSVREPTGYMRCKKGLYPAQNIVWNKFKPSMADCDEGGFPYEKKVRSRVAVSRISAPRGSKEYMAELRAIAAERRAQGLPAGPKKRKSPIPARFRSHRKAELQEFLKAKGFVVRKSASKLDLVNAILEAGF